APALDPPRPERGPAAHRGRRRRRRWRDSNRCRSARDRRPRRCSRWPLLGEQPEGRRYTRRRRDAMRVLIAEDEALMRSGLRFVLDDRGFEVVGETGRADELPEITRAVEPDVVITDIRMPPAYTDDGLRAALVIRAELPHVGVMVLSQHLMRRYAVELVGD